MNLKETIRKVLKEEEKKKDLSVPIKKLVDLYMENHKDKKYVCGYKFGMGKFATRHTGEVYQRFKITILFNSGYGSKRWPMTMAINTQEEEIMNELQDLILDTFGVIVDMYSTQTPNCEKIEESVLKEEATDTEYAVIEILKPSSRMPQKWYFQAVPLNKTEQDKIYIKRGAAGILTISTKNIKIHKTFKNSEKEEMDKYLEKLREQDKKKGEQNEAELTEKCWKGYTQKGMKTMFGKRYPNCVKKKLTESIISPWVKRRFSVDELSQLVKNVKTQIDVYENSEDAIYDTVRQLIATKQFNDINDDGTEREYWDSYLRYEEPLVKYVKGKLGI